MSFFKWCDEEKLYISFHIYKHVICSYYGGYPQESKVWSEAFQNNGFSKAEFESMKRDFESKLSIDKHTINQQKEFKYLVNYSSANTSDLYNCYSKIVAKNLKSFKNFYFYFKKENDETYDSILIDGVDGIQTCLRYHSGSHSIFEKYQIHSCFVRIAYAPKSHIIPMLISEMSKDNEIFVSTSSDKLQKVVASARKDFASYPGLKMSYALCGLKSYYDDWFTDIRQKQIVDELAEFIPLYNKLRKKFGEKQIEFKPADYDPYHTACNLIDMINESESAAELSELLFKYYNCVASLKTESLMEDFFGTQFSNEKFNLFIQQYRTFIEKIFDDEQIQL